MGGIHVIEKSAFDAVVKERDELSKQIRFDVETNSATGWMVKYTRQLDENAQLRETVAQHNSEAEVVWARVKDQEGKILRLELTNAELRTAEQAASADAKHYAEQLTAAREQLKREQDGQAYNFKGVCAERDKFKAALERIVSGMDERGPRVIAREALKPTGDTKEKK